MSEIKTFKIDRGFENIDDLYNFIKKDVDFIGKSCDIRIEKSIMERPFCITGFEHNTKRQILFYYTHETMPESLGKLIILAGAFKANIVVFLASKINVTLLEPMSWLHSICKDESQIILGEVKLAQKGQNPLDKDTNKYIL